LPAVLIVESTPPVNRASTRTHSNNPNAKVPALVDGDATVFDSHAILLYLAQKHERLLPKTAAGNAEWLSWLMLIATGHPNIKRLVDEISAGPAM